MNWSVVQRVLGLLLMIFSVAMLPPVIVSLLFDDNGWTVFVYSFFFILVLGALLYWPVRGANKDMRLRDGFLVVASFWLVLGTAGATPFWLSAEPSLTLTESVFESMCWRSPCCRCSVSAACSCIAPRRPARSKTAS